MKAVRGYLQLAPLMVAVLVLVAAGCSSDSGGNGSAKDGGDNGNSSNGEGSFGQAQIPDTLWSEYLPLQNGQVCTYSASSSSENVMDMGMDIAVQVNETQKFKNVHEESDGTHFVVDVNTETDATVKYEDGQTEDYPVDPIKQSLKYVLTDRGTLKTVPQAGSLLGYEYSVDEFMVYPTVNKLKNGESVTTSAVISVEPSAAEEQYLKPGEDKVETKVTYQIEGIPPKEITTSAGTFTDTVGVAITPKEVVALNGTDGLKSLYKELGPVIAKTSGTTIVWYARDVGKVQIGASGGLAASMMEGTTEDSSGSMDPPLKLQGCGNEASSEATAETS